MLDFFVDGIFIADVIITFFTAYKNEDGTLVWSQRLIARHYVCSAWFYVDIAASLPLNYLVPELGTYNRAGRLLRIAKAARAFRLVRLVKLLRVSRLQRQLSRIERSFGLRLGFGRLLKVGVQAWGAGAGLVGIDPPPPTHPLPHDAALLLGRTRHPCPGVLLALGWRRRRGHRHVGVDL